MVQGNWFSFILVTVSNLLNILITVSNLTSSLDILLI